LGHIHNKRTFYVVIASVVAVLAAGSGVALTAITGDGSSGPGSSNVDILAQANGHIAQSADLSAHIGTLTRTQSGVFSIANHDPVNVDLMAGNGPLRCLGVTGDIYSAQVSCFNLTQADQTGSYIVAVPTSNDAPFVVVGWAPSSATHAIVTSGSTHVAAKFRGHAFLATVPASTTGGEQVAVQFGP